MTDAAPPRPPHRDGPPRPSVSPLLWAGAAAWVGSLLGAELALRAALGSPTAAAVGWGACAVVAAGAAWRRRARWALLAGALALGLAAALAHGLWAWHGGAQADACGPREWTAVVDVDPVRGPMGTRVLVTLGPGPAAGRLASLSWPDGSPAPRFGQEVAFSSRLARTEVSQEWAAGWFREGVVLRGRPWKSGAARWPPGPVGVVCAWRAASLERLRAIGGEGAAACAAMVFGDRGAVAGSRVEEDARSAGVAWALSASGLHLGLGVLLAEWAAGTAGLGRRGRALAAFAAAFAFALGAGLRVTLLRAALVAAAAAGARLAGRRRDGSAATGAALLALLVADPAAAWDVGLLLGALAVTGIVVFAPLAREWVAPLTGRRLAWGLAASLSAQAVVAPLSAALFGGIGPYGPLVLAASAPVVQVAVALGLGGALLAAVAPGPGASVLALAAGAAGSAAALWRVAASLPGAVVPVGAVPWWAWAAWAVAVPLLWVRWPLPRRAARVRAVGAVAALAVALAAFAPAPSGPGIVVLDVGQGDAILVRDGGAAMLVDTGGDPATLRRALARARVRAIDSLVLTHAHDDHAGGLAGLAGVAKPAWIGVPDVVDDATDRLARACERRAGQVVRLRRDMTWSVGATRVRVLWPDGGERGLECNDTSVVLLLERDGRRALLLGDAEERAQRRAVRAFDGVVDVMKVAHHGSVNGALPETLAIWRPAVALVSCGAGNRFGHPHRAALRALADAGTRVRRTDLEGDLAVTFAGAALGAASAPAASSVCDNRGVTEPRPRAPAAAPFCEVSRWRQPTSQTSSPSTSSTARRSFFSTARSAGFGTGWPRWPTWTSTWMPSKGARSPPTRSSTRPTPCRS